MVRQRQRARNASRTRWGRWVRRGGETALHYQDNDVHEVPFDRKSMPHELWQTLVHDGLEKPWHELIGEATSSGRHCTDVGAMAVASHDICDLIQIYRRGCEADGVKNELNRATLHLLQKIEAMPAQPTVADYRQLGRWIANDATRFYNLYECFDWR